MNPESTVKSSQFKFVLDCLTRGDQGDGRDKLYYSVADPAGRGGEHASSLLLDQTEARRAEKNFFGDRAHRPPYLRV